MLMVSMMFVMLPRAAASADAHQRGAGHGAGDHRPGRSPARRAADAGYVEFEDVTFSYPGAEEPALCDISFTARPGEVTAIIGGTGAGKSTLVNLIPRFYDVDRGSVLVDGVDVREMSPGDLRARIGFVPQQAVLFSGTIADNIRYGKDDATDGRGAPRGRDRAGHRVHRPP